MSTKNRGFASMKKSERSRIASLGGKAISGDRVHMAQIGRKGGEASGMSRRRERDITKMEEPIVAPV